ncbi:MAG: RIP metalloprotease RseP [Candidatus Zambryskibacteria bacterium RIFOXYD2_FULL_43_10]|uniref:Zinc metalloprotease n=1 Tax=Candidatus Zambryskibacteria bacterium RIFOXYD2_FULL_43_10 TaxID=1802782 RepID=A0A1G2V6H7_9BACT|nr:MAG: RIP metalloprotease RseP [Candidatus Zambryskibacteria bacterium RIFOXYD2_FULL_43_10]
MSVIIFIIILSALIIVHEFGHFLVAKKFGIRVDEFGLGFPPRIKKLFTWKGTPFTLNWLPFGGFVKIFGENPEESSQLGQLGGSASKYLEAQPPSESFQSKNKAIQSAVLVSGVVGNFIFAWLLFSLGFIIGLPAPADFSLPVENPHTVITTVLPATPAAIAGLKSGDVILALSRDGVHSELTPEAASLFIAESVAPVTFIVERGQSISTKVIVPQEGIVTDKLAVGISMDVIGIAKLPPHEALWYGLKTTSELTILTGQAIIIFITQALGGVADISGLTGPVGIVGMVGDARELGLVYLLTFTALISINLSIINLLPFPALDGGRLFFILIEAITRKRISSKVFNIVNTAGFALLILLMLLITIQDLRNIF